MTRFSPIIALAHNNPSCRATATYLPYLVSLPRRRKQRAIGWRKTTLGPIRGTIHQLERCSIALVAVDALCRSRPASRTYGFSSGHGCHPRAMARAVASQRVRWAAGSRARSEHGSTILSVLRERSAAAAATPASRHSVPGRATRRQTRGVVCIAAGWRWIFEPTIHRAWGGNHCGESSF